MQDLVTRKRIVQVGEILKLRQQVCLVLVLYQLMILRVEGVIRHHQELEDDRQEIDIIYTIGTYFWIFLFAADTKSVTYISLHIITPSVLFDVQRMPFYSKETYRRL